MIDPELKERILRSLRWVVPELEHRFNDCRQNLRPGSQGGYSEELKELIALKRELEQGSLIPEQAALVVNGFTLKECLDTGPIVGLNLDESTYFFHYHNKHGWLDGLKRPITNLQSAMYVWKRNGQADETAKVSEWRE